MIIGLGRRSRGAGGTISASGVMTGLPGGNAGGAESRATMFLGNSTMPEENPNAMMIRETMS